ncbi:energy-coupling factor transporter transmembrane protein EcfT, partial [Lachnospiraceae bacterium OttesenSCG-928-D06]|nr:energy-coupling factor transporter transmembrane protein EcfT [Lachnospiraceae bacterium OttesenSCG-928-D06]
MADIGGIGYIKRNSPIHKLDGAAKILMVLFISIASMITFDTRFIVILIIASLTMFFMGKVKLKELKFVLIFIFTFMLLNNIMIYLFSPEEGVRIYGTRHELLRFSNRYTITKEQLFYQLNVTLKYFCILPVSLIFFSTTNPSDFAASLSK